MSRLDERDECDHGHPWTEETTGYKRRTPGGPYYRYCKPCRAAQDRRKNHKGPLERDKLRSLRALSIDSAPLFAYMAKRNIGINTLAAGDKNTQRALTRAKSNGYCTLARADEWATRLFAHPAEVWGELWWAEEETG